MYREQITDMVGFTLIMIMMAAVFGWWAVERNAMLYSVMDCMPDGSRQAYDMCYEELYGEQE